METVLAFICDYADASKGKLSAIGIGFDTIFTRTIPAVHPIFALVVKFKVSVTEAGNKDIRISLIDADGHDVTTPISATINVPRPPGATEAFGQIVTNFSNVKFPQYGAYAVSVVIEGSELSRVPFRVAPAPETPMLSTQ